MPLAFSGEGLCIFKILEIVMANEDLPPARACFRQSFHTLASDKAANIKFT